MIDKLELFMALARERHFGRAAEACNISQPTLSSAIKQLEEQLGVQLVRRGARFQGLTPEGERTLEWARRIVGDCRALSAEMRAARTGLTGNAVIAVIPTALSMVQDLTAAFARSYPDVTFTILSRTSAQILDLVGNLQADLGITYLDNEPLGVVATVPLYVERYQFVTSEADRFAGRDTVSWTEAGAVPLCLLTRDMQNRRIINRHFALAGVAPQPVLETDSVLVMISHILAGRCSGILPEKLARLFTAQPGLRAIALDEPQGLHVVGAVAVRSEPHTPLVDALLRQSRKISEIG